jgi:3-phytase
MTGRGDRADDPAIWVHPLYPEQSLILGTDKANGLRVYGLDGEERQFLPVGRVNNVDLRGQIAVASNDEVNGLSWFRIDPVSRTVFHTQNTAVDLIEPYGVCLGLAPEGGGLLAGVTYKDGTVQIWAAMPSEAGVPGVRLARTVKLATKLEGCVFDDSQGRLFIGEEGFGVWTLDLTDAASTPQVLDTIAAGQGLVADVEGVSLWLGAEGEGYLLVSAQEADRFVVYDRLPPHAVRGVFTVGPSVDGGVDGVTHTDGLDVSAAPLPGFAKGLVVVQDDGNPKKGVNQNFKLVDWAVVAAALKLED